MSRRKQWSTEVLVAGGSLEGCVAALALAKAGKQVLLTEEAGSLGGAATNGLEVCLPWKEETDEEARRYAERLWRLAGEAEGSPYPLYQDQRCKLVLQRLLREAGVTVLTHLFPGKLEKAEDGGWICAFAEKTGWLEVKAETVVDATAGCELAGLAGWEPKEGKREGKEDVSAAVSAAVKWDGIPASAVGKLLRGKPEGTGEKGGCLMGEFGMALVWEEQGVRYSADHLTCYHDAGRGETITTGLSAKLPVAEAFTLSEAQAGLRRFAYRLRDELRKAEGCEKANIIHVAPILTLYGLRRFPELSRDGFYVMNGQIKEYENLEAIRRGITVAAQIIGHAVK